MRFYYICDKCGNLADITAKPLPDDGSHVCEKCGSDALWQFQNEVKALHHAAMIRERVK